MNAKAKESMKRIGYDMSEHTSKGLPESGKIDILVTMGCGEACPYLKCKKRISWNIEDPKHKPQDEFDETRIEIEKNVQSLLKELKILE